jgi:hypothetical protein
VGGHGVVRWEYNTVRVDTAGWFHTKVDEHELRRQLNGLGLVGWELVSAVPATSNGFTEFCILILKRPVETEQSEFPITP